MTVALHDGTKVVAESTTVDPRRHTELLAPAISHVLDVADASRTDLTAVAVGIGPGPFTGLRVGVTAGRTLGAALDLPVYGVCSLDVLAAEVVAVGSAADAPFLVASDARRREVYWSAYTADGRRTDGPEVATPAEVQARYSGRPVAGAGARLYPEAFPTAVPPEYPSAAQLASIVVADTGPSASSWPARVVEPLPMYLRRPDAAPPGARKPVLTPARPGR